MLYNIKFIVSPRGRNPEQKDIILLINCNEFVLFQNLF